MTEIETEILEALPITMRRLLDEQVIPESLLNKAFKSLFRKGLIVKIGDTYHHANR